MKPSILFMGTPEFAKIPLQTLHEEGFPIVGVVTQPDKPAGRGRELLAPPCAVFAKEKKLPLYQPSSIKNDSVLQELALLQPDFIIVAAYGKLLPQRLLDLPRMACLNIHASLLPRYRGAAPINWAMINGDKEVGVSLMQVILQMDAGPVYAQKKIILEETDTAGSVTEKLSRLGAELLLEHLSSIAAGSLKPSPQNETEATHARKLTKEDGRIDWSQQALSVLQKIRGLNPWPCAYTFVPGGGGIDNKTLKIYSASVVAEKPKGQPGEIYFLSPKGIHVICGQSALCIEEVQLEGKKKMRADEFVRGYRLQLGDRFL